MIWTRERAQPPQDFNGIFIPRLPTSVLINNPLCHTGAQYTLRSRFYKWWFMSIRPLAACCVNETIRKMLIINFTRNLASDLHSTRFYRRDFSTHFFPALLDVHFIFPSKRDHIFRRALRSREIILRVVQLLQFRQRCDFVGQGVGDLGRFCKEKVFNFLKFNIVSSHLVW